MGGRGASYSGRRGRAPRGYRTVGKVRGISVIRDNVKNKGLPPQAGSKSIHWGTDKTGKINQLRFYDKNGYAQKDFDWSHPFEGHKSGTVHRHIWKNGRRSLVHKHLTKSEILKYKKAIEEATGRKDLIWEW